MDSELEALVKKFQSLQAEQVSNQITERNVVEIVNTLLQMKLVDLLYTTDAKEYLTWDELRREIVDEVLENGGRLNVVDLPGLLSVHAVQIEKVIPQVLEEDPTLRLERGELMTDSYIEATVLSANDMLKEKGSLSVAEYASQNQFSSQFASTVLMDAVRNNKIPAIEQEGSLYTKQFVRSQKLIMRAGLLAAKEPVDLKEFFKRNRLFAPLMERLVEDVRGELPGNLTGTVYTPDLFEVYRTAQINNLYASNGYIDYTAVQKLGVGNARQYLQGRYNPAEVSSPTLQKAESSSSHKGGGSKRRGGGKAAAKTAEQQALILCATEAHPLCGHALSNCFLTDKHLSNLVGIQSFLEGESYILDFSELFPVSVDLSKDLQLLWPRLLQLYPVLASCDLIEDVYALRGDAKDKLKAQLAATLEEAAKPKNVSHEEVLKGKLAQVLSLHLDEDGFLLGEVMRVWSDLFADLTREAEAKQRGSAAAIRRQIITKLQSELSSEWLDLCVLAKGLTWAETQLEDAAFTALTKHVQATRGFPLMKKLLLNESADKPDLYEKVVEALENTTQPNQLKKVVNLFHEKRRELLSSLVDGGSGRSFAHWLDMLQEMSSSGEIAVSSFHQPNKKVEREAYAKVKETLQSSVAASAFSADAATESGVLFASLCSLIVHQLFHVHLEIPGKTVSAVVARLLKESNAPEGLAAGLDVISSGLKAGTLDTEGVAKLELLRQAVLEL